LNRWYEIAAKWPYSTRLTGPCEKEQVFAPFSAVLVVMKSLKPILYAGAIVGVLDITAACIQVYIASGLTPMRLLQGVAGGVLGRTAALKGGLSTAALGLVLHFTMALTVTTAYYLLSRRFRLSRKLSSVVAVGLVYGAAVFVFNNFVTAPLMSWIRSLYLHTPVLFKPPMGWSQLIIHLFCVGLPVALVMRKYAPGPAPSDR
jgi:uncharacterized membrane protein YagU involved in acid resistance